MRILFGSTNSQSKKNFTVQETSGQPSITELPMDKCLTLVMIDPDAGGKPNGPRPGNSDKYYLHWIVVNIHDGDVSTGDPIVPYQGPTPPPLTGKNYKHEYIFQLYEQPCGLTTGLNVKDRPQWSLQQFLRGKNMKLLESKSIFVPTK